MPGILPMKVIKVGVNAQARIAQACDRCRSKKIRCDGVRPCCSQCANVGFECKTSDKLSRRAFPRGYTESLEDRVRSLEAEVRELKDLLDEKDEKIDLLSRMHSQSSQPIQLPSPRRSSTTASDSSPTAAKALSPEKDEIFKVQQSPYLLNGADGSDSYFAGTSSGRTFIEAFKHAWQENGRSIEHIRTEKLLTTNPMQASAESLPTPLESSACRAPPRLVSDRLINIFFQEWAPLFPVLHRPTFLSLYERYVNDSDAVTDHAELALLNLVFGIASLSSGSRSSSDLQEFEKQWKAAIDGILNENAMPTLQALLLAQIFCVQQGDLARLLTYKGLSTTLSARLGLQQSQKRFALDTLTCETRKKVFWTLYTVDSFTAVMLGLPKHLKDEDIQCEYPVDADDEYVTERGFQPSLPGESTKLSSALALFRLARTLSKVLEEVFPAKASYDLSLSTISDLADELDVWNNALAPHLRLQFAQDKPSTGTISSRSPLLSLAYHYTRALIHRPAVCASLGNKSSSSMMALANSSKHMIQITQLLEERGMCFASCINKDELLVLSTFGLMFQSMKLDPASKILRDNQKMVRSAVELLRKSDAPCANELDSVIATFMPPGDALEPSPRREMLPEPVAHLSTQDCNTAEAAIVPSLQAPSSSGKQLKAGASRFMSNHKAAALVPRTTVHDTSLRSHDQTNTGSRSLPPADLLEARKARRSESGLSPDTLHHRSGSTAVPASGLSLQKPYPTPSPGPKHKALNLDYLSFGGEQENSDVEGRAVPPIKPEPQPTDWEKLLGSLDNGTTNIYDACYGGLPIEALVDSPSLPQAPHDKVSAAASEDTSSVWTASDLWTLCQADTNTTADSVHTVRSGQADSVLSFSSDDFTAGPQDNTTSDGVTYADWLSTLEPSILDATSSPGRASRHALALPTSTTLNAFGDHDLSL